jgi:hypothetical protein
MVCNLNKTKQDISFLITFQYLLIIIIESSSPMILLPKPWVAFYIISSETLLKYSDR